MTRKIIFISLAIVLIFLEMLIKGIIDALMGWKSGGGAIPMLLLIGIIVMTWKACLKWAKGRGNPTDKNDSTIKTVVIEKPELPTNVKIKKFIAKEILLALAIIAIISIIFFLLKLYDDSQEAYIDRLYSDNYESFGSSEQEEFNKAKYARNKPYFDNQESAEKFCETLASSILIFVYPLRLLYYLVKWCIATLKAQS